MYVCRRIYPSINPVPTHTPIQRQTQTGSQINAGHRRPYRRRPFSLIRVREAVDAEPRASQAPSRQETSRGHSRRASKSRAKPFLSYSSRSPRRCHLLSVPASISLFDLEFLVNLVICGKCRRRRDGSCLLARLLGDPPRNLPSGRAGDIPRRREIETCNFLSLKVTRQGRAHLARRLRKGERAGFGDSKLHEEEKNI